MKRPLSPTFSLVSLLIIGVLTASLAAWLIRSETRHIVALGNSHSVVTAKHLQREIEEALNARPKTLLTLDSVVMEQAPTLGILRVVVFDRDCRVIYSTDPELRGRVLDEDDVKEALAGRDYSQMGEGDREPGEGEAPSGDFIETYVPWKLEVGGCEAAVLEIYSDASEISSLIRQSTLHTVGAALVALVLMHMALLAAVRRAETLVMRQTLEKERLNAELECKVEERTRELMAAHKRAERDGTLVAVGSLAAGVAHEINTPLGTITTCAEGLRARLKSFPPDPSHAECEEYLGLILTTAMRVKTITRKLLDLARRREPRRERVDLAAALATVATLLKGRFQDEGKSLRVEAPQRLEASTDESLFQQVVLNLATNACDHIPQGGVVMVRLRADNGGAILEVEDDGPGIPPEDAAKIFEPFFTTREGGTGLGLHVSRTIATSLGGRLELLPSPRGALFRLSLGGA